MGRTPVGDGRGTLSLTKTSESHFGWLVAT